MLDLSSLLKKVSIYASAPGRVDCGGTWDIKALALTKESIKPATVNIAINLRTSVQLLPHIPNRLLVESEALSCEKVANDQLPFNSSLGLIFAVLSHFGVSGVKVQIKSDIPLNSGLGGSSVMLIAVIGAITKALELINYSPPFSKHRIALLAHTIEDSLQNNITGLQDQLAATYGGVNKWIWKYSCFEHPYRQEKLLSSEYYKELQTRFAIVYTGERRNSSIATEKYINSFINGTDQLKWIKIRDLVDNFSNALNNQQWSEAAIILRKEAEVRDKILPEGLTPLTRALRQAAYNLDCGAAFTGGNRGGCIWAIGSSQSSISSIKSLWEEILFKQGAGTGIILPNQVAKSGLIVQCIE
ncbi:hypothetical protein HRE53_32790 (plasmid) [Acaryochloris sp. 'Moss Beach']|uniref:GHMP family kinase ATP-binding protein n=1 Tax=Acaryochloris sp. 'Moss Beach' TaxID=2740837 RepID=UPI001F44BC0E|nr:hypothetical protein [Acaryochloris sp. 'Moss Beach']UJB73412.1 hypothetical protein HRE53_32790 [Acaryochloris sp. 'Moss Beach']